ncbi:histidine kinase [Erwinia sp. E602]|uniref:FecR family protein n=1 Tax=Erwinia sp. E602 TaxID=2675378 RepID=UPI001BA94E8A|nr:FecR domain-containing protein [Erwinia sp. E602]QUG73848.1 histidine kinase [Erwinia sp. E602]
MKTPDALRPEQADSAETWLLRQQAGFRAGQQQQFNHWLTQGDNAAAFARTTALWQQLGELPESEKLRLRQQVRRELAAPARRPRRLLWPALAVLLLAVLIWPLWRQLAPAEFEQVYATQRGEQRLIALPDGSKLNLDAETRLRVAYWPQHREIWLEQGQAFFQVAHQAQRPLTVRSGTLRVTVLGTEFSVRYIPHSMSGEGVSVAVRSGAVRVGPQAGWRYGWWRLVNRLGIARTDAHLRVLRAGQQSQSDGSGLLTGQSAIAPQAVASWQQARVSFDNTPLPLALAEFARYGSVHYQADPRVAELRITGSFALGRLDSFARALPAVLPVTLKKQGDTTLIVPRSTAEKKS